MPKKYCFARERKSNATLEPKSWLFTGGISPYKNGQREAKTLIQSTKLNGLDPYVYLRDILKRFPTHKVTQIEELLPHRWKPEPH